MRSPLAKLKMSLPVKLLTIDLLSSAPKLVNPKVGSKLYKESASMGFPVRASLSRSIP